MDGREIHSGVVIGCSEDCPENGKKPFKDCNLNTYHDSYKYVEKFAEDQAEWAKVFGKAYERMLGEAFFHVTELYCYIHFMEKFQCSSIFSQWLQRW